MAMTLAMVKITKVVVLSVTKIEVLVQLKPKKLPFFQKCCFYLPQVKILKNLNSKIVFIKMYLNFSLFEIAFYSKMQYETFFLITNTSTK